MKRENRQDSGQVSWQDKEKKKKNKKEKNVKHPGRKK